MIVCDDGGWTIWWVEAAFFQPGGAFQTLDWLIEATESVLDDAGGTFQGLDARLQGVDHLVVSRDRSGGGTLQCLIYPWGRPGTGDRRRRPVDVRLAVRGPSGETVPDPGPYGFYVSGSIGDLQGREILRHSTELHGRTAEDLVARVASLCGDGQHNFILDRDIGRMHDDDPGSGVREPSGPLTPSGESSVCLDLAK